MRRVKLFVASSLDGFIARRDGSVDWLFTDQDYGMSEFWKSIDTVLIGRKTYDFMLAHGETAYPGKKNYVFSRTQESGPDSTVEWVSDDVVGFVETLRQSKGLDIWLVGGAELFAYFLDNGLVDDIILAVHPIILGDGIALFPRRSEAVDLELESVKSYSTGLLLAHYRLRNEAA